MTPFAAVEITSTVVHLGASDLKTIAMGAQSDEYSPTK